MAQAAEVTMKSSTDALPLRRHTPAWSMTVSFSMAKAKLAEKNRSLL